MSGQEERDDSNTRAIQLLSLLNIAYREVNNLAGSTEEQVFLVESSAQCISDCKSQLQKYLRCRGTQPK